VATTPTDRTTQWARASDGRTLCFAEYGDPAGWPVFSMHGDAGCRLLLTKPLQLGLPDLLAELRIRLIRHDRPGFGRSDRQPGRHVADTAADVYAIADALGIERFAVVGGSGGSSHALATAVLLAGQVTRLAVTAPSAPYALIGHEAFTAGMNPRVRAYIEAIRSGVAAMTTDFGREDAELRAGADRNDPNQAWISRRPSRASRVGWTMRLRTPAHGVSTLDRSPARRRSGTTRTTPRCHRSTRPGSPPTFQEPNSS
jgi:pimeloyl-ACP methyl ester carboxylesterase